MNILQDQTLLQLIHDPLIAADYIEEMGKPFLAKCVRESIIYPLKIDKMFNNDESLDAYGISTYYGNLSLFIWLCSKPNIYLYTLEIDKDLDRNEIKETLENEGLFNIWAMYREDRGSIWNSQKI